MDTPNCADCKFFKEYSGRVGHCKRYPPTVYSCDEDNSTNVQSPMVNEDDWCGEFKSKHFPDKFPKGEKYPIPMEPLS